MDLKIMAEDIGLPKEATAEQMVVAIRGQGAEIKRVRALNETLVKSLAEAQQEALAGKKAQEELLANEGRMVVRKAIDDQILDEKDEERFVKMYSTDDGKAFVEGYIEDHKYRKVLAIQQSLKGVRTAAIDPMAELATRKAEILANSKNMTEAQAVEKAYKDDPDLFERVTEARRIAVREKTKAGQKGGGR